MTTAIQSTCQQLHDRLLLSPEYLGLPSAERPACKRFLLLAALLGTENPPANAELEAAYGPALDEAGKLVARGALTVELADLLPATEPAGGQADAHTDTTIPNHPPAEIFPMMSDAGLDELAADIKEKGLQHPIVRHEGKVIDGRNRLMACQRAGVQPTFVEWPGTGSVVGWILSTNLHRRHLTDQQRAMVAGRVAAMLAIEGREKSVQNLRKDADSVEGLDPGPREEPGEDPPVPGAEDSEESAPPKDRENGGSVEGLDPGPREDGKAATKAAALLNVSRDATNKAAKILKGGDELLVQAVTDGTVSLDAASQVAKLPKQEQRDLVEKGGVKAAAKKLREVKAAAKSNKPANEAEVKGAPEQPQQEPVALDDFPLLAKAHAALDALAETGRRKGRLDGVTRVLEQIIAACSKLGAKIEASPASLATEDDAIAATT